MRLSIACACLVLAVAAGLASASEAVAASISFRAELKGANVVPPNEAGATGYLTATFDTVTKRLTWTGSHSGLSSKIRGTHFHGPAGPNETAGIAQTMRSLSAGSATLTDKEAAHLIAGDWYVDIHTRSYGRGEIRGQLVRGK
jgi:hypothetical protein